MKFMYVISTGTIHIGSGENQINSLFSSLNMPTMTEYQFKKCERIIRSAIEELANESCTDAIRFERKLTLKANKEKD